MHFANSNIYSGRQFWGRYSNRMISARHGMANIFAYCCQGRPDDRGYDGLMEDIYDAKGEKSMFQKVRNLEKVSRNYARYGITIH